ncbi:MAG TPA: CoA-acylating methylmalonate-semialdehyde dehydrogenase [Gemmatimonadaceae bacterium]
MAASSLTVPQSNTPGAAHPGEPQHGLVPHFIHGERKTGTSPRGAPVWNPSTGVRAATVPLASAADVDEAVASGLRAFSDWSAWSPLRRARVMFRFRELLESHATELATIISAEHGKVLSDARGEVQRGMEVVEFACGIPHLLKGEFSPGVSTGVDMYSLRQPLGVVAGITPFNFPAMVPLWMLAPAIACGNAFILKPSEKDPSCGVRLAELLLEAGAPPGVLNVVHGDAEAVNALLVHRDVQAISFVGSTPIAQHVYATAAAHGKRVQAMGGAKNHLVVMPDADLDQAVDALVGAAYGSAGERCMAVSVAVAVGDRTGDALRQRLAARVRSLRVGPSTAPDIDMGPLVTAEHRDRVSGYIALGVEEGADLVVDGRSLSIAGHERGFFLGGCLFDRVTPAMRIYQEEIFGPVLCLVRAADIDEASGMVSGHAFGNGASIFTRDGNTAREFADQVQAGMIGVNVPIPVPLAFYSFGGWKQSAFGDHNQHGMDGVRFFTKLKTVTSRWPSEPSSGAEFRMPTLK